MGRAQASLLPRVTAVATWPVFYPLLRHFQEVLVFLAHDGNLIVCGTRTVVKASRPVSVFVARLDVVGTFQLCLAPPPRVHWLTCTHTHAHTPLF